MRISRILRTIPRRPDRSRRLISSGHRLPGNCIVMVEKPWLMPPVVRTCLIAPKKRTQSTP